MITSKLIEYAQDGEGHQGLLVFDHARKGAAPTVLVLHGWEGRSEGQDKVCRMLADLGYAAFAVDLYGKGRTGSTPEECQALMTPLIGDRAKLRRRLLDTVETVGGRTEVDATRMAAIGFCFGGLCALDLARAGAPLKGVVSFHGLFTPPGLPTVTPIAPKVIAFHGWDDPMAKPDDVVALGRELTEAGADWQLHAFGGTMHAFMVEGANLPDMGILYNARSAGRAWEGMGRFLADALG
jgi:dienelactone hydrolase